MGRGGCVGVALYALYTIRIVWKYPWKLYTYVIVCLY